MAAPPFHILVIRSSLPLLGIAVGKTGVVPGSDVTQVPHDIHHLVVTEQAYYPAACPMVLLVCKSGAPENGDEVVIVIVDIADGDYRLRRFRWSLCRRRPH